MLAHEPTLVERLMSGGTRCGWTLFVHTLALHPKYNVPTRRWHSARPTSATLASITPALGQRLVFLGSPAGIWLCFTSDK